MSCSWLSPRFERIPAELRALGWVLWRAGTRGPGKPTKVPYCINDPDRKASTTDPATWGTFDDAVDAYSVLGDTVDPVPIVGAGPVLTLAAGITCIDLDRVIDSDGQLDTRAQAVVDRCESWTELSPSGTGLHIFVRGGVAKALKGAQIEVYSDARYIAITGHQWGGTRDHLSYQQPYLDHLAGLAAAGEPRRRSWRGRSTPPPDDLVGALLAKLQGWGISAPRIKRWQDGYLVELSACPWASVHSTGPGGAAVIIRATGAYDFTCLHAHCAGRDWRSFRSLMERATR